MIETIYEYIVKHRIPDPDAAKELLHRILKEINKKDSRHDLLQL